jgi:hypothetical protein
MTTSAQLTYPTADRTPTLLRLGMLAGPLYVLVGLLEVLFRRGFDIRRHALSLMSNGSLGWIQIASFICSGVLVIARGDRPPPCHLSKPRGNGGTYPARGLRHRADWRGDLRRRSDGWLPAGHASGTAGLDELAWTPALHGWRDRVLRTDWGDSGVCVRVLPAA